MKYRQQWFSAAVLSAILAAYGCADDATQPRVELPRDIAGHWEAPLVIPGSGEEWTLSLVGASITGAGTWTGEACCRGTVTITGTVRDDSLHLDVVYRQTEPAEPLVGPRFVQIDGVLDTPTDFVGIATNADFSTHAAHYVKRDRTP